MHKMCDEYNRKRKKKTYPWFLTSKIYELINHQK